jgi:hypothetical protein
MASAPLGDALARSEAMSGPPDDGWPAFWCSPWRWAHADWHRRYGASAAVPPAGVAGQRLLFRGWIDAFELGRCWSPPGDMRWFEAFAAPPPMMVEAAAVFGWIALVRAGGVQDVGRAAQPRLSIALRYRDVSCIDARLVPSGGAQWDATVCGLKVLSAMAEAAWPDVAARVAMMRAPQRLATDAWLVIERIDVTLCVTLWLAVLRRLRALDANTGS